MAHVAERLQIVESPWIAVVTYVDPVMYVGSDSAAPCA